MTVSWEKPPSPIVIEKDAQGVEWVLIRCPYCGTDLSKISHGRITISPIGELYETYWPIRCTECNHPLLPRPWDSLVYTPEGRKQ